MNGCDIIKKKIIRSLVHLFFPVKRSQYKKLKEFAQNVQNKKILEIGSGGYSVNKFFDENNSFDKSDIDPKYGHINIDVTKMKCKNEYDVIICLNVLEHVFEYEKAIENMYRALKPEGILFLCIPGFYPLHDEPKDYWRFTEYSLCKLLSNFSDVSIKKDGIKSFPYNYSMICKKNKNKYDSKNCNINIG